MASKLRRIGKIILGKGRAKRLVTVLPDDIFIVSYPKSGNTWTRFLIGNLFYQGEIIDFTNVEQKVPDIYQNSDGKLLKLKSPRILKSHEYFDPRYKKVIYIVRDPRDVLVSYYEFKRKMGGIGEEVGIDQFTSDFIGGSADPFGTWGENTGSWLGARKDSPDFLLIKYENLLADTHRELSVIAEFIGLSVHDELIEKAVAASSFKTMRQKEMEQGSQWKALAKSKSAVPFVRSGKAGGWKERLSEKELKLIESAWREQMTYLGYSK